MKKISLFIVSILLIIPFAVNAAENPSVKSLEAKANDSTITYNGTMEDGSHAVMCKLYKGDEEVDLLSSAVDNNNFEGEFTVTEKGDYKVYCANYEGGAITTADVTVSKVEEDNKSNPKTFDAIVIFISILVVSIIGFVVTIALKKRKINC